MRPGVSMVDGPASRFQSSPRLEKRRSRLFTPLRPHRKLPRDQVAHGITHMRAPRVGFIQFDQRISVRIRFPAHLLKILDQLLTAAVDQQAMLTRMISQLGVHAVHAILYQGIRAGHRECNVVAIAIATEELLHDLPVGTRRRGAALLSRGIAVYTDTQLRTRIPLFRPAQELFASGQRVGVRQDEFFQDDYHTIEDLRQHRAQRIHIEVERPAQLHPTTKRDILHAVHAVKRIVGSPYSESFELGLKLLSIGAFIQLLSRALQFFAGYVAAFGGGKLENLPIWPPFGASDQFMEMIE